MKQIIQSYRDGEVWLAEVPAPALKPNGVLVQTAASVVSAGTEKMIVEMARKSLVAKAAARPDLVKKVIARVRTEGFWQVWQKVTTKLDTPVALGYSCAGTVVEVGGRVSGIRPGDRVACAGADYATHAEYNYVPRNLCVKVPDGVETDDAAFATLGAIALQGVRQAGLQLGERAVVIGLGVLGLLTVQMLQAAGCVVLGCDTEADRRKRAVELGVERAVSPEELAEAARSFSEGQGADAVIITASTTSDQPIRQAGEVARAKGRVVVVGAVGMEVPRDIYYRKELDLRLSMSYGPGRYDPEYEERGHDYPFGYVRWTEQRNMAAFLDLVAAGKVTPSKLVTHRFSLDNSLGAYELLAGRGPAEEKYLGIMIDYPQARGVPVPDFKIDLRPTSLSGKLGVGLIGAGNFARGILLPALAQRDDIRLVGLGTATGRSAAETGEKHGFAYVTTNPMDVIRDENVAAVIIATRHDTHAQLTCEALRAGKHVFVEKPLAAAPEQLEEIEKTYRGLGRAPDFAGGQDSAERGQGGAPLLMVGFNRRFSVHARSVAEFFAARQSPLVIGYRVNAGEIGKESWVQNADEGGGRIVGEVCHFVDLCQYFTGAAPVRVFADCIRSDNEGITAEDSVVITLHHADGSVSSIQYTALGPGDLSKERVEVLGDGKAAVIKNFSRTAFYGGKGPFSARRRDKGFEAELEAFFTAIRKGGEPPIAFESMVRTTRATFAALESIKTGQPVGL
ncbi:MAG: bi-domain-containing oxidoreductase [Kiritimatiellae bacterium]|nr:bi-domain-containing oxidoreductase [Kiritimatiellia bacterium]